MHTPSDDLSGAALKTGIDARALVIPGEDPCELAALTAAYHRQMQPAGPTERFLVDSLVYADWELRRLRRFHFPQRYLDATERSYFRALAQLQGIRRSGPAKARPAEAKRPDPIDLADLPDTTIQ
ncbi:MAG: hypothetical protein LAP40_12745 [Acidobacteriia bacterium]|nr:hypothetical protein [Terriglobia bacterium]